MLLRKLVLGAAIIFASIGSSAIVGAADQDILRGNTKENDPINYIMLESIGLAGSFEIPNERLSGWLTDTLAHTTNKAMVKSDDSKVEPDSMNHVTEENNQGAQKAERISQQRAKRRALRQVTQSFKPESKPIHQPR
ncbi:hypothetical protein [Candidatus Bodocaedibacter vickermanii]|uniref:Uncharacterized protein n=1 Tax=Candidatus Bodocaedibacter vickermanii TaxID=2741701 RepID=A0A7L9RSK2_9PROT|nr:hypothetical protein CPBP_00278 [Candidatus Paracaedibacteraceae bacterium 'Lake Konstanz']